MNFWEATYLPAVFDGLRTTGGHVTNMRTVTEQYPEQQPTLPTHYRGVHRLNRDDKGRVKCVACMMCATACPANCITIEGAQAPWEDRDKYPSSFVIDELRCIFCGMCEEACPEDAIWLEKDYELSDYTRDAFIYTKDELVVPTEQNGYLPAR